MDRAAHWNCAYADGDTGRSWYQGQPTQSLIMLDGFAVRPDAPVLDVGGGSSVLVDSLLERGFRDVTVLDVSAVALGLAAARLGPAAGSVRWVQADLDDWCPERTYAVWHDRAVLHFATTGRAQQAYLRTLSASTAVGSVAVIGCFAPDGPDVCSGLAVVRYDADELAAFLGSAWQMVTTATEQHHTPNDGVQSFTWAGLRRIAE